MANKAAIRCHSDLGNSDTGSRQMTSQLSQDLSSRDSTERCVPSDREHLDPDICNRLWTPFFLTRYTIFAFITFYLAIAAGLVALIIVDRNQQGLASARTSQHYLWTYGPTAILTLAASLWGQVEYRAKQVMPWAVLRTGPTKASETLFIDYVSINQISAFFKSLRARHLPVTVTVLVSFLIRLLIVVSTTLLVLEEQPWAMKNVPVPSTEVFNSGNWNSTEELKDTTPFLWTIAMTLYNISYRPGTSKEQAVPNLDLQHLRLGTLARELRIPLPGIDTKLLKGLHDVIEVDLPVFQTDVKCETGRLTSMTMRGDPVVDFVGMKWIHIVAETSSSTIEYNLTFWLYHTWMNASADFHFMEDTYFKDRNEYVIFSGYMRPHTSELRSYDPQAIQHSDTNESSIMTILVCYPSYNITTLSITMDSSQMLLSNPSSTQLPILREQPAYLSSQDFFEYFQSAKSSGPNWDSILNMDGVGMEEVYSDRVADRDILYDEDLLTLLISGRVHHITSLLDSSVLENTFKNLFQSAAAQIAKTKLLISGSEMYEATIHTTQQRLHVRNISIYCSLGILAALTVITAILCVLTPQNTTSRDVDSIGGFTTILCRSVDLSTYLFGAGSAHLAAIQDSMSLKWCKSHTRYVDGNACFGIDFYGENNRNEPLQRQEDSSDSIQWWRPFSISAKHKALVLFLVVAIIVALEILHQDSVNHSGLVKISNQGVVRYAWLYVPVLVMMAIQVLVGMINSTSNVILPYHELRLWPSTGERTLFDKKPSLLTLHALYNSIHQRHWAIIATSLSMLLNPFLTIAAAGLYTAEAAPGTDVVQLRILDTLLSTDTRNSWIDYQSNDNGVTNAGFISNLLINTKNMVYQPWTYPGLVFPKVERLDRDNSSYGEDAGTVFNEQFPLTARLTALRPSLNCSILAHDKFNITTHAPESGEYHWIQRPHLTIAAQYPDCIAVSALDWAVGSSGSSFGSVRDVQNIMKQPSCPSLMMVYGWNNDSSTVEVAMCDGFVEELQVTTMFSLPSFDILDVQVDENTARRVENGSALLGFLDGVASSIEVEAGSNGGYFDQFFNLIIHGLGTKPLPLNNILGEKGFSEIVERIEYYWRMAFPQYLNLVSRTKIQGGNTVVNATVDRTNQYRLHQSDISTRILEVLLGAIGACVGISFWAMNTKEILPKNPCSIAAQASLLAGSSMLKEDVIPPGSEWCSDKELRERGVFDGLLFSMGWRGGANGEKRWFGIDVGKSDWLR